ncbi:hypothetical protein BC940DRAFT_273450 [Gongronella butleri]|nr:hypothetical protein BC940DRAFT_273450 [Gongronella butleri]
MGSKNNLEKLRSAILDSGGREEKVEVNQRHLIDKILARYSAEYVLYRELMQNADDASSSKVEIHFHTAQPQETGTKLPNLSAPCDKITFKNNGIAFRPEDWQRLKRIAEGNPDEQKIGAFGVGFYSLFSVCENPFVFSGAECMAFYFKGDQLFARRAPVPENERGDWTVFLMDMREPMEMPNLDHFAKFLTTSMGFTANLREISVFFNQTKVFSINKRTEEPRPMVVDARKVQTTSPKKMFTIGGADMRKIQLTAEKYTPPSLFAPWTNLLSSRSVKTNADGLPMESGSMFLRVVSADLGVQVPFDLVREMERSTKKKPPRQTRFQLVYTNKDELDASEHSLDLFKDLVPFPQQGRVFIGFPTHQTTGCCCHMAARFIPTVERESIDFADRYLSVWNRELLAVGGLLARIVYNDDMDQVHILYQELLGDEALVDKTQPLSEAKQMLDQRAAHTLLSFSFQPSTPSPIVSSVQEERFVHASKLPLRIMTSHGVQPATITRTMPDESYTLTSPSLSEMLNTFVKSIPTLSTAIEKQCKDTVRKLTQAGILVPLGMDDVLKELDTRSLNTQEMIAAMKWFIECAKGNPLIPKSTLQGLDASRNKFMAAAVVTCSDDRLLQLSNARTWQNPKLIALDMPVPNSTLPFVVSKAFLAPDLAMYFGMSELSIVTWTEHIAAHEDRLQLSPEFSEKVLSTVSRGFNHLSSQAQQQVVAQLKPKTCIPTRFGMKLPTDTYFSSVNLFDDLPTAQFQQPRHVSDAFLTALGVRKHVDLQLIFDRLLSDGSWSHVDLIKYLTGIQNTLADLEIRRLQQTAIFTKEGEAAKTKKGKRPTGQLDEQGHAIMETVTKQVYVRYKAGDLYIPSDTLRQLGLPLLDWHHNAASTASTTGRWRTTSEEAKFMAKLGLQSHPPLAQLLQIAAPDTTADAAMRRRALTYLIDNADHYRASYMAQIDAIATAFLPCRDGKTYAAPKDCFSHRDAEILGFQVLHDDLVPVKDRLGVKDHPSPDRLLAAFRSHIRNDQKAMKPVLEYMASQMGRLQSTHWAQLNNLAFVPVKRASNANVDLVCPTECYFESSSSGDSNLHKELFLYVDFGAQANGFLRNCGVKNEPTTPELAAMLVKDPQRFWELCGGGERYLTILRQMASQADQLKKDRALFRQLSSTPCLVAIKRTTSDNDKQTEDNTNANNKHDDAANHAKSDDPDDFIQYRLARAADIYINDDSVSQQIFAPLSAPMEPLLEEFYTSLGSDKLSSQIKETYTYKGEQDATARSRAIMGLILERTPIILYQMRQDFSQRQKEPLCSAKYVERHLKVIQVQNLCINRVFKPTGEKDIQPTTACVDRAKFAIYVTSAGEIDFYDIAMALCYLLFARIKFNDTVVAERYLTVSLNNLRRKGVPVDRILNIKKHVDQPAPSPAPAPPTMTTQSSASSGTHSPATPPPLPTQQPLPPAQMDQLAKKVQGVFGDCDRGYIRQLLAQQPDNHAERVIERLLHEDYPKIQQQQPETMDKKVDDTMPMPPGGLFDRFLQWGRPKTPNSSTNTPSGTPPPPEALNDAPNTPPKQPSLPKPTTITPNYESNIQQNLKRAIHSCKPFTGQHMFTRPTINTVTEASTYCDTTPGNNLRHVGQIKQIECYAQKDVDPETMVVQHRQGLLAFATLVTTLAQVFELKLNTIHLYYDLEGATIAFNRSGSLFLNLRYFLALHHNDPKKRVDALVYWYMTICHELAHNFVALHNAEHEFYFSSFAEVYMTRLLPHLSPQDQQQLVDTTSP